jgi:hypothetical protein
MKRSIVTLFMALLMVCAMGAWALAAETVRLAVTDLEGMEELQREFGVFKEKLGSLTGYDFEFFPVNNRLRIPSYPAMRWSGASWPWARTSPGSRKGTSAA